MAMNRLPILPLNPVTMTERGVPILPRSLGPQAGTLEIVLLSLVASVVKGQWIALVTEEETTRTEILRASIVQTLADRSLITVQHLGMKI